MFRRPLLLALALLFFLAANLHLCCRAGVDGEWTRTRYSLADARRGELAACAAAEEICPRGARMPKLEQRLALSFRPPDGGSADLSARILARVPGVSGLYAVSAGASHGRYADAVEITPVYGRSGSTMSPSDMAMVVSELVPAVFTDREGNRIMG